MNRRARILRGIVHATRNEPDKQAVFHGMLRKELRKKTPLKKASLKLSVANSPRMQAIVSRPRVRLYSPLLSSMGASAARYLISARNISRIAQRMKIKPRDLEIALSNHLNTAAPHWKVRYANRVFYVTPHGPMWIVDAVRTGMLDISKSLHNAREDLASRPVGTSCIVDAIPFVKLPSGEVALFDQAVTKDWI